MKMGKTRSKVLLWENTLALMKKHYGGENLSKLARDTAIGPGSTSRIKGQETSVGVDVIEKIAGKFKVEPWQLLAPSMGTTNPDKRWGELSPLARAGALLLDSIRDQETRQEEIYADLVQKIVGLPVSGPVSTPDDPEAPDPATAPTRKRSRHS